MRIIAMSRRELNVVDNSRLDFEHLMSGARSLCEPSEVIVGHVEQTQHADEVIPRSAENPQVLHSGPNDLRCLDGFLQLATCAYRVKNERKVEHLLVEKEGQCSGFPTLRIGGGFSLCFGNLSRGGDLAANCDPGCERGCNCQKSGEAISSEPKPLRGSSRPSGAPNWPGHTKPSYNCPNEKEADGGCHPGKSVEVHRAKLQCEAHFVERLAA